MKISPQCKLKIKVQKPNNGHQNIKQSSSEDINDENGQRKTQGSTQIFTGEPNEILGEATSWHFSELW
ncbi:hypothetical protein BDA96_05G132500 [Sorghum bicolor]|uniref:Uncharacterized protein n=2 Tax=Sorghum bicolor TaxID=4558 RepID=A0A921QX41_SORBI|nr:hypothetical protein BDA96_05G132500 [Sorghum bicolor]KXG28414.1 hypothetical protein SORBI_3005G119300 [Sorghum bicolor]